MRLIFCLLLVLLSVAGNAFTIKGTVTDMSGEKLPYTNIHIKGTTNGTSANSDGQYVLETVAGKFEIVFQHIGYKQRIELVDVQRNIEINVKLEATEFEIRDVVINGNEDPAIAVIKKAIEKRKYFLNAVESYSCDAYVKGVQRLLDAPFWAEKRLKSAGLVVGKMGLCI